MLKVVLPYPNREEEKLIIRANVSEEGFPTPKKVVTPQQIIKAREIVKKIYMDEKIERYIVDIVYATYTILEVWVLSPHAPEHFGAPSELLHVWV